MIDPRLAWFAIGATCSAVLFGWPWHPRFSRFSRRRPYSSAAIAFRATEEDAAKVRSKIVNPLVWEDPPEQFIRMDEGRIQRGNGSGGPTTPKPGIIPRGTRSISYPDPGPDRQPTNPFTGDPVKPQPHGGRVIPVDTP